MTLLAMMHDGDHDGMGDGMMSGWMAGWMILWFLVGVAVLALAVAGTVWLVRNMSDRNRPDDVERELGVRYARGDLTTEEYDERLQRLRGR
jgi:putative membrane protein